MKLATLRRPDGSLTTAVVVGDEVIDVSIAARDVPTEMSTLLAAGPEALARLREAATGSAGRAPLDLAALAAPVPRPGKFLAVGLNYADHIAESGAPTPDYPTVFAKASSCVNGPTTMCSGRRSRTSSITRASSGSSSARAAGM